MSGQANMICPGCQTFQPRAVVCNSCGVVVAKVGKPDPSAAPRPTRSDARNTSKINFRLLLLIVFPVIGIFAFFGSENSQEANHTTDALSSDSRDNKTANPIDRMAVVNPAAAARIQRVNVTSKLHTLKTMLYQYSIEGDDPPTNDEGLQVLVDRRYLSQSDITDDWGNTFVYRLEWGKETPWGKEYKIFVHSKGPDGKSGNSDDVGMP